MSDVTLNKYIQYGTGAARAAYTPSPPQLSGADVQTLYLWKDDDGTEGLYWWTGAAWELLIGGAGSFVWLAADPGSPSDGDLWFKYTGGVLSVNIRDAGATKSLPLGNL